MQFRCAEQLCIAATADPRLLADRDRVGSSRVEPGDGGGPAEAVKGSIETAQ